METLENYSKIRKYCIKTKLIWLDISSIKEITSENFEIPEKFLSENLKIKEKEIEQKKKNYKFLDFLNKKFLEIKKEFSEGIFFKINEKHAEDMANWVPELKLVRFEDFLICMKYSNFIDDYLEKFFEEEEKNEKILNDENMKIENLKNEIIKENEKIIKEENLKIEKIEKNEKIIKEENLKNEKIEENEKIIKEENFKNEKNEENEKNEKNEKLCFIKKKGKIPFIFKKWYSLNKSMEFRVYIKNSKIISIVQRNLKNYYKFLPEFMTKKNFEKKIKNFFSKISKLINSKFYSFDIYIDIPPNNKIKLIDINFKNENLILLKKNEIENFGKKNDEILIRFLKSEGDIVRSMHAQDFPLEFFDPNFKESQDLKDFIDKMNDMNNK